MADGTYVLEIPDISAKGLPLKSDLVSFSWSATPISPAVAYGGGFRGEYGNFSITRYMDNHSDLFAMYASSGDVIPKMSLLERHSGKGASRESSLYVFSGGHVSGYNILMSRGDTKRVEFVSFRFDRADEAV